MKHRAEAQRREGMTDAQQAALAKGRQKGTNHREGTSHSDDTKQKISRTAKAYWRKHPEEAKARGAKTRGPLAYNWKGGSSRLNTAVRRMTEHRKWMDAVVRRDERCLKCGVKTDLEAHHIRPLAALLAEHGIKNREQARDCAALWNVANGETLCEKCHCSEHGRKHTPTGNGRRKQPKKVRRSMKGDANPNYKGGTVSLTCPQCGGAFEAKKCRAKQRKFCSTRCKNENQRKNA
jgi:hypothetical protein